MLGKLPVPGRPTIWIRVGQGPTAHVVGAGGGCLDIFTLIYPVLSPFSLSVGDGSIYTEILSQRAVKPKTTNQPTNFITIHTRLFSSLVSPSCNISVVSRHFCIGLIYIFDWGWSGGAKVLGKLAVLGRPTILIIVGQGPTALAVGAG